MRRHKETQVPRSVYPVMVNAGNGGLRTHFTLTFNIKMTGPLNTVPIVLYPSYSIAIFCASSSPRMHHTASI
jgi:hypothetical protein